MCWYKTRFYITISALGLIVSGLVVSCKPDIKENNLNLSYFDIKGYFNGEITRLSKLNPAIIKTVKHNNDTETKTVHIPSWKNELSLFVASDINKPAWRDSYNVQSSEDITTYRAKTPDLTTRRVIIKREGGKIKWVLIFNYTQNILYRTSEKLTYFPDSLYLIEKLQHVKLLNNNRYQIKGLLHQ